MKATDSQLYYIKNSPIHGSGVFAKTNILSGTKILAYNGKKILKRDFEHFVNQRKNNELAHPTIYFFEFADNCIIDGDVPENHARFINHSCDENCDAIVFGNEIWIVAQRYIFKDEELSFDYGFSLSEAIEHPCRCRKSNCAKYIIRKDLRWKLRRMIGKTKKL